MSDTPRRSVGDRLDALRDAAERLRLRLHIPHVPSWRDVNQRALGLAAIVVVSGLATVAFTFGTLDLFSERYEISAVFPEAGGLKTKSDVRVAGVSVGEVTGVKPDFETGQVVVTMEVDEDVDLGPETSAEIGALTLLGGYYVGLSGPVEEPYLADLPDDDERRRIPLERTNTPVSLIGVLSDTTSQIQAIDVESINEVLRQLAAATDRNSEVVPSLLDSLSTVGAAVSARDEELRNLVTNAGDLSEVLAERDQEILTLVDSASVLLETLTERRDELASILGAGSDAVVTLTDTITRHREDIDKLLGDAHILLEGIARNTDVINTGLAWAGPLFGLVTNVISESGGFDVAIEGLVGTGDQLGALLGILIPPGGAG